MRGAGGSGLRKVPAGMRNGAGGSGCPHVPPSPGREWEALGNASLGDGRSKSGLAATQNAAVGSRSPMPAGNLSQK
jgi:hypothetical protein